MTGKTGAGAERLFVENLMEENEIQQIQVATFNFCPVEYPPFHYLVPLSSCLWRFSFLGVFRQYLSFF